MRGRLVTTVFDKGWMEIWIGILTDKETDQDDGESDKGSRGQHDGVGIALTQTLVVQDHTGDCDNL